jgi:hypothetical protein
MDATFNLEVVEGSADGTEKAGTRTAASRVDKVSGKEADQIDHQRWHQDFASRIGNQREFVCPFVSFLISRSM